MSLDGWRRDRSTWAVLGLGGIVALLFSRAIFHGEVFFKRDVHLIWYPQVEAFVRAVAAGSCPTWDPLSAFGQPLLADPSSQILYPWTWLNLLLLPWTYYTVFVVVHVWLTGIGLYALARRWGLSTGASFVASGVWMACGPLQSLLELWHHFAAACWIPWVFLAAEVALEARRPAQTLFWGAAMAGQVLAGSADVCAMTGLAVAAHVAVHRIRWKQGLDRENRGIATTAVTAAVFALGLTAALWLPALDVVSRAARRELLSDVRTYWSLHPLSLLDLVFPNVWTLFVPLPPPEFLREIREPFLGSLYLGLPTLGLVAAGLRAKPRRRSLFFLSLAAGSALIALGRHAIFYDLFLALLPPARILRYPVKAIVLTAFSWAVLTGMGVDACRQAALDPRRRWRLGVAAPLAALAALAWTGVLLFRYEPDWVRSLAAAAGARPPDTQWLPQTAFKLRVSAALATAVLVPALLHARGGARARWAGPAIALLALADLIAYHHYLSLAPRLVLTHRPEVLSLLQATRDARLYVYDYESPGPSARGLQTPYQVAKLPRGWTEEQAGALGMQMALAYATGGRWKLRGGYEGDYRGLHPRGLAELAALLKRVEGKPVHSKLLRMGAISHVLTLHAQGGEGLLPLATFPGLFREPLRVFSVPDPLPRAYVIAETRVLHGAQALSRLLAPDWDPSRELIISEGEPLTSPASFSGWARIVEEAADRVVLDAELSHAGYVVLVDSYDPGWRADVDAAPAPLVAANLAFRAVRLEAGRHRIVLRYQPRSLVAGLCLSAATLVFGIACLAVSTRRSGVGSPSVAQKQAT